jgi:hypothetical protein
MNWGAYGILVVLGLFIVLFIVNPKLSCFGKKITSPFYPVFRKRKTRPSRQKKGEDYGFHLSEDGKNPAVRPPGQAEKKTEDYGFRLD